MRPPFLRFAARGRLRPLALALPCVALLASGPAPATTPASVQDAPDPRFAGLTWTFVRIRYSAFTVGPGPGDILNEPWAVDYDAADHNLSRRVAAVTSIRVNPPIVMTLEDQNLWTYPWIYMVEPGNLRLKEAEVPILREFLLRGGTLTFDDFHGPIEWANVERELRRVFPDRTIVELGPDHPIFRSFYTIDHYPQVPGLGSFFRGVTWEKGGYVPHLRAVLADDGRPMVLINWNTDMGDGWEWSNAVDYPGYIKYTADAYRMMINEVTYVLTH
jgi:hypothetical protein